MGNFNERSLENLNLIRKGEIRNPNGKTVGIVDLPNIVRTVMSQVKDAKEGKTRLMKIIERMSDKAEKGDVKAAALLLDRAFGKAVQPIIVRDELVLVDFKEAE